MEAFPNSTQVVRMLAGPARRKVVAALVLADAPTDAPSLAAQCGLSLREVVDAADRLRAGGMVTESSGMYALRTEAFHHGARSEVSPAAPSAHGDQPADIARILDTAIVDGKLVQWPSKQSKRLVVLDYLAQQFEIGKHYDEQAVNDVLRPFNDDVATTRRYLIDAQFLDRDHGQYWRCGGSV